MNSPKIKRSLSGGLAAALLATVSQYAIAAGPSQATPTTSNRDATAKAISEAPNLIVNGDFEQATDNTPANWEFSSANPEIFRTVIAAETGHHNVLNLTARLGFMSGYWSQKLPLKPNTKYRMTALVRLTAGKMLIYITDGTETGENEFRTYVESAGNHPLVPLFWEAAWLTGSRPDPARTVGPHVATKILIEPDKWTPISMDFATGTQTALFLKLGAFFAPGTYSINDVMVTEVQP